MEITEFISEWHPIILPGCPLVQTKDGFKTFDELEREEIESIFGWLIEEENRNQEDGN